MNMTTDMLEVIDEVIHYLENNRRAAADALFPTSTEGYRQEWREKSAYRFWGTLDTANRERLVKLARAHHADVRLQITVKRDASENMKRLAQALSAAEGYVDRARKSDGAVREDVQVLAAGALKEAREILSNMRVALKKEQA